jgi:small conductance mechanosensitive channel
MMRDILTAFGALDPLWRLRAVFLDRRAHSRRVRRLAGGYLATASVAGLAIAFGSQGLVQDIVTGLTLIFSDLIDVGDLVEVSGQTGVVRSVTMRFVELENSLGGTVFVPNRTISSVTNYPRGYVRCFVDVSLLGDAAARQRMQAAAVRVMTSFARQFPGISVREPAIGRAQARESRLSGVDDRRRLRDRGAHVGGPRALVAPAARADTAEDRTQRRRAGNA